MKTLRPAAAEPERPAELQHFVLTRFSYRDSPAFYWNGRGTDPLDPRRLAHRFRVFEVTCLPSVLAQTNQDFDWVVIIDRDLPDADRERLRRGIGGRPRTHLHRFVPGEDLGRLTWLAPYRSPSRGSALTTNLDDDDAIPMTFVEALQAHIRGLGAEAPPLKTFGSRRVLQWDLVTSADRPLGSVSPWHSTEFVHSLGFSVLCRPPVDDVSVYALNHTLADIWFERARGAALRELIRRQWRVGPVKARFWARRSAPRLDAFQALLGPNVLQEAEALAGPPRERLFYDLSADCPGPLILTNHVWNEQGSRIFETKAAAAPVTGAETFPHTAVDLDRVREDPAAFGRTWRVFLQVLREGLGRHSRLSLPRRMVVSVRRLYHFTAWFLRF